MLIKYSNRIVRVLHGVKLRDEPRNWERLMWASIKEFILYAGMGYGRLQAGLQSMLGEGAFKERWEEKAQRESFLTSPDLVHQDGQGLIALLFLPDLVAHTPSL